ncbi:hypothetical protein BH11PSE9_BH11PSE9_37590 [soil metagenome]
MRNNERFRPVEAGWRFPNQGVCMRDGVFRSLTWRMARSVSKSMARLTAVVAVGTLASGIAIAQSRADGGVMYRCPGNDYTNALSAKEAKDKGCHPLDAPPLTIIQGYKPRAASGTAVPPSSGPAATRIDPAEQRARDSDARRILEAELARENERLAAMKAEYNNGEPERRGDEKNFQKYIDRVADLKTAIARKESDIVALKRELAKTPP